MCEISDALRDAAITLECLRHPVTADKVTKAADALDALTARNAELEKRVAELDGEARSKANIARVVAHYRKEPTQ